MVRTTAFQAVNRGSIPRSATNKHLNLAISPELVEWVEVFVCKKSTDAIILLCSTFTSSNAKTAACIREALITSKQGKAYTTKARVPNMSVRAAVEKWFILKNSGL